jgi:hypothetical protein
MHNLKSIMEFLNQDSGAISALAAVIYAMATITLIFWTVKYVRLTRSLAASSSDQVNHIIQEQKERLQANKRGLHELAKIILIVLNKLPNSKERAADLLDVTLWTEQDLVDMRHLARGLGGDTLGNVFWAIYHLNEIREIVLKVRQNHPGKDWTEVQWSDYQGTLRQAKKELSHLLELL